MHSSKAIWAEFLSMPGLPPLPGSRTALAEGCWAIPVLHSGKTRTKRERWGRAAQHQLHADLGAVSSGAGEAPGAAVSCPWTAPKFSENGSVCMWKTSDSIQHQYWVSERHSTDDKWHMPEVCSFTATAVQPCSVHKAGQALHPRRCPVPSSTFWFSKGWLLERHQN